MATQYVFHLGNHPELSAAELEAMVGHAMEHEGNMALTRLPSWFDRSTGSRQALLTMTPEALIRELGGCIKISEMVGVGRDPIQTVIEALQKQVPEGKIEFGLNLYPFNKKELAEGIRAIKEGLKERHPAGRGASGRSVRFLNQEENLPSATIEKSGILKKGTDMNIVTLGGKTFITRTIAVQPFDTYRHRDYEKPARLPHDGMLPPKLAQMMINLARLVPSMQERLRSAPALLYDPFCGSGTILGEAMLKGMKVVGSDVDANAVKAATKNLAMLAEAVTITLQEPRLFVKDAITPYSLQTTDYPPWRDYPLLSTPPDLVVSELDLGPPLIRPASIPRIEGIQNNLMPLYRGFLTALAPLLKPGTPVVLAFPLHYASSSSPLSPLKTINYQLKTSPTPHPLRNLNRLLQETGFKSHRTLTYHRPGQAVGREIRVLEKI